MRWNSMKGVMAEGAEAPFTAEQFSFAKFSLAMSYTISRGIFPRDKEGKQRAFLAPFLTIALVRLLSLPLPELLPHFLPLPLPLVLDGRRVLVIILFGSVTDVRPV